MIQRSNNDEKDPARGTWEFPGGHREDGDVTSLHTGIREWEEEVGQRFPEGGHVTHVHRSGPYVLHTVVIPQEKQVDFSGGRATTNPDDPDGDDHEQSAWWDPEHAKKNPALRSELKGSPVWGSLPKAASVTPVTNVGGNEPEWTYKQASAPGYNFDADLALLFTGELHDDPEPALPSTTGDNAEDEDPSQDAPDVDVDDEDPNALDPGLPVERTVPWGFPESAADHPDPMVAQPGSADVETDQMDDSSIFRSGALIQVPDGVPPELAQTAAASPVVAGFMQTAGFRALMTDAGPGGGAGMAVDGVPNDADIAAAARAALSKTAAKDFSFAEQQELIGEGGGTARARNFSDLKIAGTHYESLGDGSAEDDEWFML